MLSFSRFKNLLDLPVNVLKNMSSTDPWDVLCTAGANNFVSIIMVQKTKSCSLMPLMQPAVHFSCLLFSSKGMTFKWGKKMKMKNENTTWIPCPSVPYIILKKWQWQAQGLSLLFFFFFFLTPVLISCVSAQLAKRLMRFLFLVVGEISLTFNSQVPRR